MASPYDIIPGKIFIGGVPPLTSQETIQRYFEQFGELCDCVLMQDKATGKSRGFGFVTYKDSRILDKLLSKPHIIDGKEVDCKRAIPRDQQNEIVKEETPGKTKKLFVGGLPQSLSEEEFRQYFEQFGSIEDSVIMVDKDSGKSRGFGFVTFDSEDAVEQVIQRYYDNKIDGKWVECKRAQPKDTGSLAPKKGGGKYGGKESSGYGSKNQSYYDGGSQKSSRSTQHTQDPYNDDSFSSGHGQNPRQQGGYDMGGYPPQQYQGYNMGYQQGYDPNMGYPGDYNQYGNAFGNPYGGYNQGYPNQYGQHNYMNQGYQGDPMAYGGMGYYQQQGGHQQGQGYGYGHGHQGHRGGHGGRGGHHNNESRQQRMMGRGGDDDNSVNKHNGNVNQQQHAQNSNQGMQTIPDDPAGVGPLKGAGGNKKQEIESRYYTPY